MKIALVSQIQNGEEIPMNSRGMEEVEVNDLVNDITCFSIDNKTLRIIGLGKNLYRMTLKSFKELKREVNKRSIAFRYDNLRKR